MKNATYLNPGVITVPPIRTMFSANVFLVSIGHYKLYMYTIMYVTNLILTKLAMIYIIK